MTCGTVALPKRALKFGLLRCIRLQSTVISHETAFHIGEIDATGALFRGAARLDPGHELWRHCYRNRQRKTGHLPPKSKRVPFNSSLKSCLLHLYLIPARDTLVF